ncbi:MurR/RpiR family transcriptional regulator [Enterococcus saccharolyticus]|uniref:Sugar isomerase n=1 Tax=Candidatus Enterococcus willemsii TaxID=1857215 RepID=A0ABQ6Z2U7_9ENTE|nr:MULTISPECIES: MurR/RpiR family transcriptional regulator [Enterococcus]KAF1305527.1 sugar isomerase [Enterococcus sp. CU12B]MCD5002715.1 MurR/RpiR family transcriptional regulator [Enterococcus saccharolyticus]
MLLVEKMQETNFSPAEQNLVDYILQQSTAIDEQTIKEIATATFVHPSTLIRLAKKLGYQGWSDLKTAFIEEQRYLNSHFEAIDPNLPFKQTDGLLTIAQKIAALEQTTIEDTLSLLHYDQLKKATELLDCAKEIKIFTSNANILISQDFALKMRRLKKRTAVAEIIGEHVYEAHSCEETTCAILISYTGENHMLKQILPVLKQQGASVISLTSIGESTISQASDCNLSMTTRERLYSKIGNFTTSTSICYLLDVLYAAVFSKNYHQNLTHLINLGEAFDKRTSTSPVMEEPPMALLQFTDSFLPN